MKLARSTLFQFNAIGVDRLLEVDSDLQIILVNLSAKEINDVIENTQNVIDRIEQYEKPEDSITPAMQWSEIWSHARFGQHQGNGIAIWQTENGCPPNTFMANYNRVAGANTQHSRDMATIIRSVSPLANIQCRGGPIFPTNAQANTPNPQVQIVSRSNNNGINPNAYNNQDQTWDDRIYNSLLTATQSSGNTQNAVISPGKALNAITVGNVDIDANPDVIWFTSGWQDSVLGTEKPDVGAPGEGTALPAPNGPTGGTSAATAHTAGFIANLMDFDASLIRNPQRTKALLLSGATTSVIGGTSKVGAGGIDYRNTSQHYQTYDFDGPNINWNAFDAADGNLDGWITVTKWLQNNKPNVRAAIAWMSRGVFVNTNAVPSTDYDIEVYDPNGNYVGGSHSRVNTFELVDVTVSISGNYQFKINRFANPDPASRVALALSVNFDN